MTNRPLNILCISRFFKGEPFIQSCHAKGHKVYLLASSQLKGEAWPWESIKDSFFMEEDAYGNWNMKHVIQGLAYKMRSLPIDICVALDDFDVENTAHIREHFRIPGMGETTSRYFRDKLAMRMKAEEAGIPVPAFTALFHDAAIHEYTERVPPPWLIKPRSAASARGIRKIHSREELWTELNKLGDLRHNYLVEKFAPGDVFHVDGLNFGGKVLFSRASQYLDTPLEVSQGGGIFRSQTIEFGSEDDVVLQEMNAILMETFGMQYSASHSEFIKREEDGKFYFLETASRVGGANLAEMVEASSGINLWSEWAKIEIAAARNETYELPEIQNEYGGIVVSLSRYQRPDTSSFDDAEVVWRMNKEWHIGLILRSPQHGRVRELLDAYTQRIAEGFHASLPPEAEPMG